MYEIDLDSNVLHIKSLDKPDSPKNPPAPQSSKPSEECDAMQGIEDSGVQATLKETAPPLTDGECQGNDSNDPWPDRFSTALAPFLSENAISQVRQLYLEGPEPPRVSDSGWGSRPARPEGTIDIIPEPVQEEPAKVERGKRGGRGGRGGSSRRGRPSGRDGGAREDNRKVFTDVCDSSLLCCLLNFTCSIAHNFQR